MVKEKKIIKDKIKSYTVFDVEKALKLVQKGVSISAASKAFKVPYATLHSRVKGKYALDAKPGPSSIFSHEEEKEIVRWIFEKSKHGSLVKKEELLDRIQNIVIKTKRQTPFTNGRPSKHWYKAFLRRNPEVSKKINQTPTKTPTRYSILKDNVISEINKYQVHSSIQKVNISFQESMDFVESHIDPSVLEQFKCNKCSEWEGELQYKELYMFWLRCKNSEINNLEEINNSNTEKINELNTSNNSVTNLKIDEVMLDDECDFETYSVDNEDNCEFETCSVDNEDKCELEIVDSVNEEYRYISVNPPSNT